MGFLSSLTGSNIGKATLGAIGKNEGIIKDTQANTHALNDTAENRAQLAIDRGIIGYQPWVDYGKSANTTYGNALGLGGTDAAAAARSMFQTSPGYDFQREEGERAAQRGASAGGLLASGNLLAELQDRGNGLANQEWGSWLDRLNGVSQTGLQATGQQQEGYNASAGLIRDSNDTRLGLETTAQQALMGINNDRAQVKEQQAQTKGSFLGGLLKGGLSMGAKALSGGLF